MACREFRGTMARAQELGEAQWELGKNYRDGTGGVAKNEAKAVECFVKGAALGSSDAQNELGVCYEAGIGVAMDKAKAVEWYTKAAEQGNNDDAQWNLGVCYEQARGVAKDEVKAVEWYTKAAEQAAKSVAGSDASCVRLNPAPGACRGATKAKVHKQRGEPLARGSDSGSALTGVIVPKSAKMGGTWLSRVIKWGPLGTGYHCTPFSNAIIFGMTTILGSHKIQ